MKGKNIQLPPNYRYLWFDEVDSTNQQALRHIAAAKNWKQQQQVADSWFLAGNQTSGRGTRGNEWISRKGNIFASFLTRRHCPARSLPQISVLAGLAAFDAIARLAPRGFHLDDLCLKWPNDVLLKGRKVCGILVESRPTGGRDSHDVIVGTGINLAHHPDTGGLFAPVSLRKHGWECSREQLIVSLVQATRDWFIIWRNGDDFESLRLAWLEKACHTGQTMQIEVGNRLYQGRFSSLSGEGALVLIDEDGQKKIIPSGHIKNIGKSAVRK